MEVTGRCATAVSAVAGRARRTQPGHPSTQRWRTTIGPLQLKCVGAVRLAAPPDPLGKRGLPNNRAATDHESSVAGQVCRGRTRESSAPELSRVQLRNNPAATDHEPAQRDCAGPPTPRRLTDPGRAKVWLSRIFGGTLALAVPSSEKERTCAAKVSRQGQADLAGDSPPPSVTPSRV